MPRIVYASKSSEVPSAPVDDLPTLVYWNITGLGSSIRLAYQMANIDFVDVRINAGDDPSATDYKEAWMGAKESLRGNPLLCPNLPYLLDGDASMTQSDTILRHLGRKYDLYGPPGQEYLVDWVLDELKDLESGNTRACYGFGPDKVLEWFEDLPATFGKWVVQLLKDKEYAVGGTSPSIADAKLYMFLCRLEAMVTDLKPKASFMTDETIVKYMQRMQEHPQLKEYINGPNFVKLLNNPHAKWNYSLGK